MLAWLMNPWCPQLPPFQFHTRHETINKTEGVAEHTSAVYFFRDLFIFNWAISSV